MTIREKMKGIDFIRLFCKYVHLIKVRTIQLTKPTKSTRFASLYMVQSWFTWLVIWDIEPRVISFFIQDNCQFFLFWEPVSHLDLNLLNLLKKSFICRHCKIRIFKKTLYAGRYGALALQHQPKHSFLMVCDWFASLVLANQKDPGSFG